MDKAELIKRNRYSIPSVEYHGDRPNLIWNQFLTRLFPAGTVFCPKVYRHRRCK